MGRLGVLADSFRWVISVGFWCLRMVSGGFRWFAVSVVTL